MLDKIAEHPTVALFFLALGVLSCAKFALKAAGVLLQTFVLPGTGVSNALLGWYLQLLTITSTHSSRSMVPARAPGRVRPPHRQQSGMAELILLAVVTGASEGIGKEFALQLAKKGFNIVVSARNAAALDALVAEIGQSSLSNHTERG